SAETEPADEPGSWGPGLAIGLAVAGLWFFGAAIGLARLLGASRPRTRALIGNAWQPDFWTAELQARLARSLGLKRFPDVYLSRVARMPRGVGVWGPGIVWRDQAPASGAQPQWEAVLLHEAAHIARRDHWAVPVQQVAVALFWWCPLVYPLSRR